ncbi:MAG TPA: hypothetical protein EYP98_06555, partial [Planctomycetes bacterium]|nr:hypothetical protein [Planctomycetota bacterium]
MHSSGVCPSVDSGGVELAAVGAGGGLSFDPEFIDAFTIGSKNRFLGDTLQVNIEGFYWEYKGQQITYFSTIDDAPNFGTANGDSTIKGVDLVVEAATENKELKSKIFAMVEDLVDEDAILCSNSSHLEPEVIFANAKHKGRTGVVHYFFPAERNLLVEVVPGADTDDATTKWLMSFYEQIGKVPIEVQSRYGYALDPVFEGLFYACALLAEAGVGTTKQIDVVCKKTFRMGVGSFTAMNLTGGNPITAVGLDNYTTKIGPYFRTPDSLKDKVQKGEKWDVPARGEKPEVPEELAAKIRDNLLGAYFGLCGEIVDAGLITVADFNMGLAVGLDMKPAFAFMNELGTKKALELVVAYAANNDGF